MDLSPWRFHHPVLPVRFWLPPDPAVLPLVAAQLSWVEKGRGRYTVGGAWVGPDLVFAWVALGPDGAVLGRGEEDTRDKAMAAADAAIDHRPFVAPCATGSDGNRGAAPPARGPTKA